MPAPDPFADLVLVLSWAVFGAMVVVFVVGSLILRWRQGRREARHD